MTLYATVSRDTCDYTYALIVNISRNLWSKWCNNRDITRKMKSTKKKKLQDTKSNRNTSLRLPLSVLEYSVASNEGSIVIDWNYQIFISILSITLIRTNIPKAAPAIVIIIAVAIKEIFFLEIEKKRKIKRKKEDFSFSFIFFIFQY